MINYIYTELLTHKYQRTNLTTDHTEIVTVTNKNNLPIQEHLRLLNLNDQNYTYKEIGN